MKSSFKLTLLLTYLAGLLGVTECYASHKIDYNGYYDPVNSGYINVDSGRLFYQKFGTGEPMVIVHGGPGLDQNYLLPQMLELAKDHELIFYDQRGSGNSLEASINSKYVNLDQFSDDLEKLRSQLGLTKFILLGHSWGGLLSMDYAIKHPENVSSLILLNSAPADYKGQKSFMNEFAIRTMLINNKIATLFDYNKFKMLDANQINDLYRKLFVIYFKDKNKVKNLTLKMSKGSAVGGFRIMPLMSRTVWLKPEFDLFPGLRKMKIPTLVVHGNQDVIPAYTAKEISEAISGSEIAYLNNCGHFPYIEAPVDLFKSIRSFLDKVKH